MKESTWSVSQRKFSPKNDVASVQIRKKVAITVSRVASRFERLALALKNVEVSAVRSSVWRCKQLAGDLDEVVADVAQVLPRAALEPGELQDRRTGRGELLALRHDPALDLLDLLLEAVDLAELRLEHVVEHLGLEGVDPRPPGGRSRGRSRP